jgi:UTP--glucose-1-phosphate uridylyltransferase
MIKKAVIAAAGLGTRLLSATKEQPKEMLPVFALGEDGKLCLKPMVQLIFEQLHDCGLRHFYFIVGRGKRMIQDHFAPDRDFVGRLRIQGKNAQAAQLESFYAKLGASNIVWVDQPEPKGFGDAVMRAESLVGGDPFLVHAGDAYILSPKQPLPSRLIYVHSKGGVQATLTVKRIEDPRQYGVAEVSGRIVFDVNRVQEKPRRPKSKFAIMPIYIFTHAIFDALRVTKPGVGGEIQLTDAVQELIKEGQKVQAVNLNREDFRLDIGTPETYWETLCFAYHSVGARKHSALVGR